MATKGVTTHSLRTAVLGRAVNNNEKTVIIVELFVNVTNDDNQERAGAFSKG